MSHTHRLRKKCLTKTHSLTNEQKACSNDSAGKKWHKHVYAVGRSSEKIPVSRVCLSVVLPADPRPVSTLCNGPWTITTIFPTLWRVNIFYQGDKACEERRGVERTQKSNLLIEKFGNERNGWSHSQDHNVLPSSTRIFFFTYKKVKNDYKCVVGSGMYHRTSWAWEGGF